MSLKLRFVSCVFTFRALVCLVMGACLTFGWAPQLHADDAADIKAKITASKKDDDEKPEYPPLKKVIKDYKEIESEEGDESFYKLWKNDDTGVILARLPKNYASSSARQFIATTVSGGELRAGLQADDFYVYWRKYGKRIALMSENLRIKGSDEESKSSVSRLFTDRVLLDVPILTMDS